MAEIAAGLRVEHPLFLEAGKGIGIQHLCPLVAVVARGIAGGAAEEVAEVEDVGLGPGGVLRGVALKCFFDKVIEVRLVGEWPVDVQCQVHLAEAELAHIGAGFHVVARRDHLFEEVLRDGFVRLVVAGKAVEALPLPAPILHDLGGQLDEVPGHVDAVERLHFDLAAEVVEEVSEFVENRLDLAVSQEGGLPADGGREVATDESEVGAARRGRVALTGDEIIHPGTPAL